MGLGWKGFLGKNNKYAWKQFANLTLLNTTKMQMCTVHHRITVTIEWQQCPKTKFTKLENGPTKKLDQQNQSTTWVPAALTSLNYQIWSLIYEMIEIKQSTTQLSHVWYLSGTRDRQCIAKHWMMITLTFFSHEKTNYDIMIL